MFIETKWNSMESGLITSSLETKIDFKQLQEYNFWSENFHWKDQKREKKKTNKKENLYTGFIDFTVSKVLEGHILKFLSCPQGNNPFWDHVGTRMKQHIEYSHYEQLYPWDTLWVRSNLYSKIYDFIIWHS